MKQVMSVLQNELAEREKKHAELQSTINDKATEMQKLAYEINEFRLALQGVKQLQ